MILGMHSCNAFLQCLLCCALTWYLMTSDCNLVRAWHRPQSALMHCNKRRSGIHTWQGCNSQTLQLEGYSHLQCKLGSHPPKARAAGVACACQAPGTWPQGIEPLPGWGGPSCYTMCGNSCTLLGCVCISAGHDQNSASRAATATKFSHA